MVVLCKKNVQYRATVNDRIRGAYSLCQVYRRDSLSYKRILVAAYEIDLVGKRSGDLLEALLSSLFRSETF